MEWVNLRFEEACCRNPNSKLKIDGLPLKPNDFNVLNVFPETRNAFRVQQFLEALPKLFLGKSQAINLTIYGAQAGGGVPWEVFRQLLISFA